MTCINCFFSPEYQRNLKCKTLSIDRFENRLGKYKELFLEELRKLVPVKKCNCTYSNELVLKDKALERYLNYTNNYLNFLIDNSTIIEEFFDLVIDTYYLYIKKSYKHATEQFWNFVNIYKLSNSLSNSIFNEILFFRGRYNDKSFDDCDPHQYFHIPFNERYKVGNQRFSVSGQPMLYFGNSVYTVCKELEKLPNELSIVAFIPTYNIIDKINEINRPIFEACVNNLPGIYAAGSHGLDFNSKTALQQIRKSILCEVLTFPTKNKGTFVEEYVLPQAYTTLLIENGWKGIVFPSTKDFSDIMGAHKYCNFNYNFAIFTNYDSENNYDEDLFKKFIPLILKGPLEQLSLDNIRKYMSIIKEKNNKMHTNCVSYICNQNLQVEYMQKATINNIQYYNTEIGNIELNFFKKLFKFTLQYMNYEYNKKSQIKH